MLVVLIGLFGGLGAVVYYELVIEKKVTILGVDVGHIIAALPNFVNICIALVWIPVGVAFGLFLEFIFRVGDSVDYDGLRALNPGRWKVWRRAFNTVVTAYVFAFIIGIGAIEIGILGVNLKDFVTVPWVSLVVGFVSGFTYPFVRDTVGRFKPGTSEPTGAAGKSATTP
jgi:hypothetical protein